ncbi:ywlC [Nucleospora cyclopteri]
MKILNIESLSEKEIKEAFKDVVVIPTETVYGLAGRIDNDEILRNIFKIKNRPVDNPLIVHISNIKMLNDLIKGDISQNYKILIDKYWPGPLTLIFKSSSMVSKIVMGSGNSTVAIRMPAKKEIRKIIEILGVPLAAPSANTSGKPSATTLQHAINDLGNRVNTYIDGGPCKYGLESTVLGEFNGVLTLLRPGSITKENIEKITGVKVKCKTNLSEKGEIICPGTKYKHYSPNIPVYLFINNDWKNQMETEIKKNKSLKIGIVIDSEENFKHFNGKAHLIINLGETITECCKNCFSALLNLEKKCDIIFVKGFEKTHEGLAIMDRLEKASTKIFK